jgi:hypothetical protein
MHLLILQVPKAPITLVFDGNHKNPRSQPKNGHLQ